VADCGLNEGNFLIIVSGPDLEGVEGGPGASNNYFSKLILFLLLVVNKHLYNYNRKQEIKVKC